MRISDWSSDVCSSDLDTLFIAITERRPLALWQRHRTLALVDEDGVVITDRRLGRFATLPIVIGDGAPERAKGAIAMLSREPDLLARVRALTWIGDRRWRSEEHTSELQSLMRISYDVFCLKKKKQEIKNTET